MYIRKVGIYMNIISTGIFSDVAFTGNIIGAKSQKSASAKTDNTDNTKKQTNTDKDTYEHVENTGVKAGYDRPKSVLTETQYKQIDSDGIQEGVELSDAAKDLLKELREKYGDKLDISVANWSTDEESDYYASLTSKEYSVLINPELLEQMASDESVKEQYESILSGAGDEGDKLAEALGDDADSIKSFSITIDADGKTSYAVKMLTEMVNSSKENSKTNAQKQQERIEEKREEERKEKKEAQKEEQEERIQADSLDELIEKIKNKKASA
jgi:hypothetical protein